MKYTLLCLLCMGCTGEVWRADSRFTADERAAIDQAAETWQAVGQQVWVAHGVKVTGYENTGKYIVSASPRTAHMIDPTISIEAVAKYVTHPGRELVIVIPENIHYTPLWQVVAHEFGHSLKLGHVADPRAMMYFRETRESENCLTKVDIDEMCRAAGCPGEVPRGCDELP